MFSKPRLNVIQSDSGFSVEVLGRTGLRYSEGAKTMDVYSEYAVGPSGLIVWNNSIRVWNPPFENELVDESVRLQVLENIKAAFRFYGFEIDVAEPRTAGNRDQDALFCDLSLDKWIDLDAVRVGTNRDSRQVFRTVRFELYRGNRETACDILREAVRSRDFDTRSQIEAYHLLRTLGVVLSEEKSVLGVVVETAVSGGTGLLAAYLDNSVLYYSFAGSGIGRIHLNHPLNDPLDEATANVLNNAAAILPQLSPCQGSRRPPPPPGWVRLNILTPQGICFGEGPSEMLDRDALTRPLLRSSIELMTRVMALAERPSAPGSNTLSQGEGSPGVDR